MKAKNIRKIITISITTIIFLLILIPNVHASGYSSNITQWKFGGPQLPTLLSKGIGTIIAFLRNISIIVTVIVITILGIKYMVGSLEEKSEYKKDYVNIVIGTLLISGILSIISAVFSIAEGFF